MIQKVASLLKAGDLHDTETNVDETGYTMMPCARQLVIWDCA